MTPAPDLRVRVLEDRPVTDGDYVLYWMIAARRTRWNFALQHAVAWAARLGRPVLVLEPLRAGYRWASDRLHTFVLQGMADNRVRCAARGVAYYPYVEPDAGAGRGLLTALAARAAVVVTDDYPAFFLPRMLAASVSQVPVRFEAVDSNGLLPLRAAGKAFPSAYAFRRFLQGQLRSHLAQLPEPDPLAAIAVTWSGGLPGGVERRWPAAPEATLADPAALAAELPIDHAVVPAPVRGGSAAGEAAATAFVEQRLTRYDEDRNQPERDATSGLSPYLHFGHVSAHEVFSLVMTGERWTTRALASRATGQRERWWGVSAPAEAFLDQLVTWRELGFNTCHLVPDHDEYRSLPAWARQTLEAHASDPRPHIYALAEFERARTHDPLWNAAQAQLVREGRMHNYLRMLWGKKILEWTRTPQDALAVMIELNNKYALDGRDPNSYSGIFWVLGRYDRPWAPQRPIFGAIRYMSSENTARKLRVRNYIATYSP